MFNQRKTDSYDLVGTNARNSDEIMKESQEMKYYGHQLINKVDSDSFGTLLNNRLEQCTRAFPALLKRHSSIKQEENVEEYYISNNRIIRVSHDEITVDVCQDNVFQEYYDMPFDVKKSSILQTYLMEHEDMNQIEQSTTQPSTAQCSPNNGDIDPDTFNRDDAVDKLLQDLDFINQPLVPKRIRKQKSGTCLALSPQLSDSRSNNESSDSSSLESEEEKRRRKNKEQVKVLKNEYIKNPNWDRPFMKDLAKKTGLKTSQVYKWNWDQKKKEIEDQKLKRLFYPNEIFQVTDANSGKNLTKPVFQKFVIMTTTKCL